MKIEIKPKRDVNRKYVNKKYLLCDFQMSVNLLKRQEKYKNMFVNKKIETKKQKKEDKIIKFKKIERLKVNSFSNEIKGTHIKKNMSLLFHELVKNIRNEDITDFYYEVEFSFSVDIDMKQKLQEENSQKKIEFLRIKEIHKENYYYLEIIYGKILFNHKYLSIEV